MFRLAWLSALGLALLAPACANSGSTAGSAGSGGTMTMMDGGNELPPPTFAPTFTAIYREIIRANNCTLGLCHGDGGNAGALLLFPQDVAYEQLVDVPVGGVECQETGLLRVEPGEPDQSLFYLKSFDPPPCGDYMPPDELLSAEQLEQIRRWIELGAPND